MNFKHNQKVRFNYQGEEMKGTYRYDGIYPEYISAENGCPYNLSQITNLRPALKSFDDPQVGDVYVDKYGYKNTVIDYGSLTGKVYLRSESDLTFSLKKEELIKDDFTILQDEEEEKKDPRLTKALENVLTTDWKKLVETFVEEERIRVLEEVEEEVKKLIQEKVRGFPFPTIEEGTAKEILSRIQQLKDKAEKPT